MYRSFLTAALAAMLCACTHLPSITGEAARWHDARQLVVVTTADWNSDHGELRTFARDAGGHWQPVASARPVVIGRSGAAWGIGLHAMPRVGHDDGPVKREGDGRSPAGTFAIGEAFGYEPSVTTALSYAAMDAGDYCIDVSGSPLYNRIVDAKTVGAAAVKDSTEPMRRDLHADGDQRYKLGFVIEHNPRGAPMGGSCIFAHEWKAAGVTTAGCTAMPPTVMEPLMAWLDARQHPVFVLLPIAQYRELQSSWQLPALSNPSDFAP